MNSIRRIKSDSFARSTGTESQTGLKKRPIGRIRKERRGKRRGVGNSLKACEKEQELKIREILLFSY